MTKVTYGQSESVKPVDPDDLTTDDMPSLLDHPLSPQFKASSVGVALGALGFLIRTLRR